MARRSDPDRARSVKAVFDDTFSATERGGAVLLEKVIRTVGLRKTLSRFIPEREGEYTSARICEQTIKGLLCRGKGFQAAEVLRADSATPDGCEASGLCLPPRHTKAPSARKERNSSHNPSTKPAGKTTGRPWVDMPRTPPRQFHSPQTVAA